MLSSKTTFAALISSIIFVGSSAFAIDANSRPGRLTPSNNEKAVALKEDKAQTQQLAKETTGEEAKAQLKIEEKKKSNIVKNRVGQSSLTRDILAK